MYAPCSLKWIEAAQRPNPSARAEQTPLKPFDLYEFAKRTQSEELLNGVSLADWYHGIELEKDVPATCPASQEIVLYDFPLIERLDDLPMELWDSVVGKIEVEGGCAGSVGVPSGSGDEPKVLSAKWAQRIRIDFGGLGKPDGSFTQFYEESSDGSSSGDDSLIDTGGPLSRQLREEHKYEDWVSAIRRRWFGR